MKLSYTNYNGQHFGGTDVFSLVVTECGRQRETVSYNSPVVDNPKGWTIFSCDFQENQEDINLGNNVRMLQK